MRWDLKVLISTIEVLRQCSRDRKTSWSGESTSWKSKFCKCRDSGGFFSFNLNPNFFSFIFPLAKPNFLQRNKKNNSNCFEGKQLGTERHSIVSIYLAIQGKVLIFSWFFLISLKIILIFFIKFDITFLWFIK